MSNQHSPPVAGNAVSRPSLQVLPQTRTWSAWRPLVVAGAAVAWCLGILTIEHPLLHDKQALWAVVGGGLLALPVCALEHRGRCLVGLFPGLALLGPTPWWGLLWAWAGVLGLAAWLAQRQTGALPAGLKQRQLASQLRRYPRLHGACMRLATAADRDQVARIVVTESQNLAIAGVASAVYLPQRNTLQVRARTPLHPRQNDAPADDTVWFVASERRPLVRRLGGRVRLLFPLTSGHDREQPLTGVLEALVLPDTHSDDYNSELQEALARMAGIALGTVDLLHQARSLALRDSLTGLFGQHEFRRRCEEALSEARRQGQTMSLIMCDLDHLKAYNDRYGHAAGDQALQAVAKVLAAAASGHLLGRWGGEEFMLLLSGHNTEQAAAMAENLRQQLAQQPLLADAPQRRLSASFGVAQWQREQSFAQLMAAADQACYQAKAGGRNQVITAC